MKLVSFDENIPPTISNKQYLLTSIKETNLNQMNGQSRNSSLAPTISIFTSEVSCISDI
jgi:hypothetical protein